MSYDTIEDLRSQLGSGPKIDKAYADKMLHQIPDAPVVDREKTILEACRGKRVLEFGATGPLHDAIRDVAMDCLGIDRASGDGVIAFDLDDVSQVRLPHFDEFDKDTGLLPDVIVCGEVIEHLSNPGWFLTRLRKQYAGVKTIITVPNAFGSAGQKHLARGIENVNIDHVAWYSFRTLKTLLERAGYRDLEFAWYRGQPLTAEGLIVLC